MTQVVDLDPRTNAFRPDLADVALRPFIQAKKFVEPALFQCVKGVVPLWAAPDEKAKRVSEIRYGEFVDVLETRKDGFAWIQNRNDRYVGYIRHKGHLIQTIAAMMNRIIVLSTFVYAEPDVHATVTDRLTLGSFVSLDGDANAFYPLASGGFVFKKHIAPSDEAACPDYVFTAGQLLAVPYLSGGRTPLGLDAAGLVQLVLDIAGIDSPRDADLQRGLFGHPLPCHWRDVVFHRGDLVFFEDHVGIMTGADHMIHASPFHMQVVVEPLAEVVARGLRIISAGRPS